MLSVVRHGLWVSLLCLALGGCAFTNDFDRFSFEGLDGGAQDGAPDGGPPDDGAPSDGDPCANGGCACDSDADCDGPHEVCLTTSDGRECACLTGYTRVASTPIDGGTTDGSPGDGGATDGGATDASAGDGGVAQEGCIWSGVLEDPGFGDPASWTAERGALVNSTAVGDTDPGEALFAGSAVCDYGELSQTVTMPSLADSEPLVAQVTYKSEVDFNFGSSTGIAIGFNDTWHEFRGTFDSSWQTRRICLGETAYGGDVTVAIQPHSTSCTSGSAPSLSVDGIRLVPAMPGECPDFATVRNGDFEDTGGWASLGGGGSAGIAPGVGQSGTRGLRLATSTLCQGPRIAGRASWPLASTLPTPAVQFWWVGSAGRDLVLSIQGRRVATFTGTGSPMFSVACIPPWAQGLATELTWSLPSTSGACANADVREFFVDNMQMVSNPVCSTSKFAVDSGFEQQTGGIATGWQFDAGPDTRGTAEVLNDASLAHGGSGVLSLQIRQECSFARASTEVVVPEPGTDAGPVVKFWYRAPTNPETTFSATAGAAASTGTLDENGAWTEASLCLDPNMASRVVTLQFSMSPGGGTCATTFAEEEVLVDDVSFGTDPGCPAM